MHCSIASCEPSAASTKRRSTGSSEGGESSNSSHQPCMLPAAMVLDSPFSSLEQLALELADSTLGGSAQSFS